MGAAVDLRRIAADVAAIPDAGLYAAAKLVKNVALDEARTAVSGGDLLGKKRKPIRLKARDDGIRSVDGGRAILIRGTPAGPWVWVNRGTRPHRIRRRRRGPLRKMSVLHPGTRGRHVWIMSSNVPPTSSRESSPSSRIGR